jgi:lactate dehydrogenase-like 2-hydroxyacid dehydrogenase
VDEDALIEGLKSCKIFSAGLDVHYDESNVSLVPIALDAPGIAIETHNGFERLCMENIESVLSGKGPLIPVSRKFVRQ